MTKQIHTNLDDETWKLAVMSNIRWVDALKLGIKASLGLENKKKKALLEEKEQLEAKIVFINQELDKIRVKEAEEDKKYKGEVVC